jgi:adenylate cyclase
VASVERRLAAIVSADVVGYTRLMEADEAGTHARLKARFKALVEPKIAEHGGRIVKLMGDGLLAEFGSAVDAVNWSVEIQAEVAELSAEEPDEQRIEYRIGVNIGEVIVDGDDIFGDGVNVAARLQEIAEPGGVCISEKVWAEVRGKLGVAFADGGAEVVKNITDPIRVWRWSPGQAEAPSTAEQVDAGAPPPLPDKPSIAVLPFDNLSGDPEQEFFADGMAEDVITALSKYRWFFVIARNSSFTYKGTAIDVKRIAQELGVRYVLEGSVRKGGNRIRVTGQLIDAETGNHIWAERYDRDLEDLFAVQDEIVEQIVSAIEPELGTAERERAKRKPPQSLDAWDRFQRGLWHVHRINEHDHAEAERLMREVIEIDPSFGPAYAYLALRCYLAAIHGFAEDDAKTLAEGHALGTKAVTLDRNDPVAHFALARILTMQGETETAIAESKTAISLNPNCTHGHHSLGWALYWGRADAEAAFEHFSTALRLNPRDPLRWITLMMTGAALRFLERYDEAIEWGRAACQYSEAEFLPHLHLAASFGQAGRIDEARAAITKALESKPDLTATFMSERYATLHPAMRAPFFDGLRKAGLPE